MNNPMFDSDILCVRCGYWYSPETFIDEEHVCAACRRAKEKETLKGTQRRIIADTLGILIDKTMIEDGEEMIYFIRGEKTRLIKIGYTTTSPLQRMKDLQVGSPDILSLVGYIYAPYYLEREIHSLLYPFRTHGEWFDLPIDIFRCVYRRLLRKLV